METFEGVLKKKIDEITVKQRADLLAQVKRAIEANDIAAIGTLKAKYRGELAQALTDVQKELFEIGKKGAAAEMGEKVPPTRKEVSGAMLVQNTAIIDGMVDDTENSVKRALTQTIAKHGGSITNTAPAEALAAATEIFDKVVVQHMATLTTVGITGSVNMGRTSIFERYPEKIYAMQFSAIIDRRTTQVCRSLDGRVVRAGSSEYYDYSPPRHYRCRSIWVEILQEETFKPDITGIPASIPANATIDGFKDIKAPIVYQGSPAIAQTQKDIEETKKKLVALDGKYPNRADQYKSKIQRLEDALQGAFSEYCRTILRADGVKFLEK